MRFGTSTSIAGQELGYGLFDLKLFAWLSDGLVFFRENEIILSYFCKY